MATPLNGLQVLSVLVSAGHRLSQVMNFLNKSHRCSKRQLQKSDWSNWDRSPRIEQKTVL